MMTSKCSEVSTEDTMVKSIILTLIKYITQDIKEAGVFTKESS